MPIFTFPPNIYVGPVISNPFKADEIECTIDPPGGGHPNHWRARLTLHVFSQNGLSNGQAGITLPRCTIEPAQVAPASGSSLAGRTVTWTFANLAVNTVHLFTADFTPDAGGSQIDPTFEVDADDITSLVSHVVPFTP